MMQFIITWYCMEHCSNWSRTLNRVQTHNRHPVSWYGVSIVRIWKIVVTALLCIWFLCMTRMRMVYGHYLHIILQSFKNLNKEFSVYIMLLAKCPVQRPWNKLNRNLIFKGMFIELFVQHLQNYVGQQKKMNTSKIATFWVYSCITHWLVDCRIVCKCPYETCGPIN